MITKEELLNIGNNKRLENKGHIEKDYFQDIFLFHLYKETNNFIFKGGTALYKLYHLPRFSEDLDFSLAENVKDESLMETIKKVVNKIEGFSIKDIKELQDSILIKISCNGVITKYNTLRIDISLKNKILIDYDVKNYIPDYIDIPPFSLKVLKPEEIISEKIHALLNRKKARDLYDLFFLFKQFKFDRELTIKKLNLFNQEYSLPKIKKNMKELEAIWASELEPFVLQELPGFNSVEKYVLEKLE